MAYYRLYLWIELIFLELKIDIMIHSSQSIINLNLDSAMINDPNHNIILKSNDEIVIYDKGGYVF